MQFGVLRGPVEGLGGGLEADWLSVHASQIKSGDEALGMVGLQPSRIEIDDWMGVGFLERGRTADQSPGVANG